MGLLSDTVNVPTILIPSIIIVGCIVSVVLLMWIQQKEQAGEKTELTSKSTIGVVIVSLLSLGGWYIYTSARSQ